MRSVPERPAILTLAVLLGCFVVGPFLGLRLGSAMAPDSELAQVASVFAFPLAFFAGLLFWLGLGVVTVLVGGVWNLVRGRIPSADSLDPTETLVPPGYGSFPLFSILFCGVSGLLVALVSPVPLLSAVAVYGGAGAAYGLLLWLLAHHGYLPFPEPS